MKKILFLCLGNICRSPLAEGAFLHLVAERGDDGGLEADSAGTGGWHVGESPDPRSVRVARDNGVDISRQRARQLQPDDFAGFDWIVAMDRDNLHTARARRPQGERFQRARVVAMADYFPPGTPHDGVPDPYYGGPNGFSEVWSLLTRAMPGLLEDIEADDEVRA
jgi:protein-tyrosine phosphatase